ncbi:MAG: chromosome segregation protein SMC [bacterium]
MPFLKSLSIFGFKSFAEKTTFKFQDGLTAVVGPNGCGKSNIYEAIRWVLGEQNPYLLRSKSMTNVIFNGSEQQKPLGVAEVSLAIENSTKILPIEFNEVSITRRLFRSGESEYLLNKAPCRLKDITQLFLDTGLGHAAYSLIEQNKVDFVVNSKAADRKAIFEEAAGIAKYKVKKQEAISKLQLTSQNLIRIDDLLTEISRQRDSLYRQAKKTQRYLEIKTQLQNLEITLFEDEYRILNAAYDACSKEYERIARDSKQINSNLTRLNSLLTDKKLQVKNKEAEIKNLQPIIFNLAQEIQRINGQLLQQKEKEANIDSQLARIDTEIKSSKDKIDNLSKEITTEEKNKEEALKELEQTLQNLTQQETILSELEQEKEKKTTQLEEAKIEMIDFLNQLAHIRNQLSQAQIEQKNIKLRMQRLMEEEEKTTFKKETIEKNLDKLKKQIDEEENKIINLKKRLAQAQSKKEITTQEVNKTDSQINTLREEMKVISGRLSTLQELQKKLDGYLPGVKTILTSTNLLPEIAGVVVDLIDFDHRFEKAIEVSLGENIQAVILNTTTQAEQIIPFLKEKKAQRVTFIPLEEVKAPWMSPAGGGLRGRISPAGGGKGVEGWALDLINYDKKFQPAFEYLLGNVLVAKDLPTATKIIKNSSQHLRIATLDGELIDSNGIIQGGLPKISGESLINRKKQIMELTKKLSNIELQLKELEEKKLKEQTELSSIQLDLTNLQVNIHSQEIIVSNLKRDFSQTGEIKEENLRQLTSLKEEKSNLHQELIELNEKIKELKSEEETKNTTNVQNESFISALVQEVKTKEAILKDKMTTVTQIRVKFAQLTQLEESLTLQINRLKDSLKDLEKEIDRLNEETNWLLKEKERETKREIDYEKEIEDRIKEKEEGDIILNKLQDEDQLLQQAILNIEEEIKTTQQKENDTKNSLHQIELQSTEHKLKMENITNHLLQEYKFSISPDKEPNMTISKQELLEEIEKSRQKLEAYKEVNLMAPAEYEEINKRFEFLNSQREDLINAKQDLQNLIQQIDTTSQELFDKTFSQIKANFEEIVKSLFEGGMGTLRLTNGASSEEVGIEINVQPPGKRLQSMSLLSGGEKALVSICLLFAIFLYKPSPFCVLDEVDAALDEANILRFNKLLKSFSQKTQFLIITHNKLTISNVSTLYGITMETPGVSKVLSVKLVNGNNQV